MPLRLGPPRERYGRLLAAVALGIALVVVGGVIVALAIDRTGNGRTPAADTARTPARAPLATPRVPRPRHAPEARQEPGTAASEATGAELGLPAPRAFSPGSAARALAEFMDAWHDRQWDRAAQWTTASWRNRFEAPAIAVRTRFAPRRLRGWAIVGERLQLTRGLFTVAVVDLPRLRNQLERRRLLVNVRKETPAGMLSAKGRWAVDPSSIRPLPGR